LKRLHTRKSPDAVLGKRIEIKEILTRRRGKESDKDGRGTQREIKKKEEERI
jgi:hypothetical protein